MIQKIKDSAKFIIEKTNFFPEIGIILGSGLGGLVDDMEIKYSLPYESIPDFPVSTVEGHAGKLILGMLGGKKVVAMQGRFHYYEGYTMNEVVFPVRVMKFLGIKTLFLSNAAGGLNPSFEVGDLMIIRDHINLLPNPLIGKNFEELGTRFPEMSEPYSKELIRRAKKIARDNNIKFQTGVYVGSSGPTLETQAEYNYLKLIGADATGMSTVPEVIAACHMGIQCFAISIITNVSDLNKMETPTSHEEVQKEAGKAAPRMSFIFKEMIASI